MLRLVLWLVALLLTSCAALDKMRAGEWVEPAAASRGDDAVAGFDWSAPPSGIVTSIDGQVVGTGYKRARLLPGRHVIEYAYYTGEFGTNLLGRIELDLVAGHTYRFDVKLCFWCSPRKYAVWVDDETAGTVVWGQRPDWPGWYL